MHINTPILGQQIMHQHEPFVDHGDEGIGTLAPGVTVGNLFQDVGLFGKGITANLDIHREIRAHVERRIDVDQFEAALFLDLFAQRAVLQRGKDELVVAPDQFVCPALELSAAKIEKVSLQSTIFRLLRARLVHLLDDLKGQDDIADLARLAVPDQFHLPLVLKQQKAVLLRQRPVRLDKADNLLLFLLSQSWHKNSLLRRVLPCFRPMGIIGNASRNRRISRKQNECRMHPR